MSTLPLVIEPDELASFAGSQDMLVVDVRKLGAYREGHVPGAVNLIPETIVAKRPPVGGLVPETRVLAEGLGAIGLRRHTQVVAYDEEGGGWAGRLLWTLDVIGHPGGTLLNGGWLAWKNEGHAIETEATVAEPEAYPVPGERAHLADAEYILDALDRQDIVFLDTRTPEEFRGEKRAAARGGHIPGAVNMDWVIAMDPARNLRFKSEPELRRLLEERGVTRDKEVVVYCQTHHRSSHTYLVLKSLGYPRIKGYPGAWSDWGNRSDTPVES